MTGLDSLGTLPGILNYSEILKYSIELEIQESTSCSTATVYIQFQKMSSDHG